MARAFLAKHAPHTGPAKPHECDPCITEIAALVRAVRRECAAVAVGAVMGCPAFTDVQARLAADDVRVALRELNRAPRRGR